MLTRDPDVAVNAMLARLGLLHDADRAWILMYDGTGTRFRNTHEWARGEVKPYVDELQFAPVSMILWLHRKLVRNEVVLVDDIDGMPRQARALRAEFKRQGNRSVLCVPLMFDGRLVGSIGYDAVREVRRWGEEVAGMLRVAGDLALLATRKHPPVSVHTGDITLRDGKNFITARSEDIRRIEAARDYTVVRLADGRSCVELRGLNAWESMLPSSGFVRVSRSLIVNLGRVKRVERGSAWAVTMDCGAVFPIGRAYRHLLRQHASY